MANIVERWPRVARVSACCEHKNVQLKAGRLEHLWECIENFTRNLYTIKRCRNYLCNHCGSNSGQQRNKCRRKASSMERFQRTSNHPLLLCLYTEGPLKQRLLLAVEAGDRLQYSGQPGSYCVALHVVKARLRRAQGQDIEKKEKYLRQTKPKKVEFAN